MIECSVSIARASHGAAVSPGYVDWSWRQIARGATEAGRDPADLDLASNVLVSVSRDPREARDATKDVLAYYLHRVEPIVLSTSGADPEELDRIRVAVLERGGDEQIGHDLRGDRIEASGRLVGQHNSRSEDERPGNGDTLLLAAGKFGRTV